MVKGIAILAGGLWFDSGARQNGQIGQCRRRWDVSLSCVVRMLSRGDGSCTRYTFRAEMNPALVTRFGVISRVKQKSDFLNGFESWDDE